MNAATASGSTRCWAWRASTPRRVSAPGFGAYHMEYEYCNSSMPYKYMREAIQDVNPAAAT